MALTRRRRSIARVVAVLLGLGLLAGACAPAASTAGPGEGTVVFVRGWDPERDWEIYTIRPDSLKTRRLTANEFGDADPAWSPDGARIAFASNRDGDWDIYTMNADGGDVRQVTDSPRTDGEPTWSPDGRWLAFTSSRTDPRGIETEIHVTRVNGTRTRRVTRLDGRAYGPAWSPDGRSIAFTREDFTGTRSGLYLVAPDGTGMMRLTTARSPAFPDVQPSWAPDGRRIAFSREIDAERFMAEIFIVRTAGGGLRRVTFSEGDDQAPAWSPDGKRLVFGSTRGNRLPRLFTSRSDGTAVRQITRSHLPDYLPDWKAGGQS